MTKEVWTVFSVFVFFGGWSYIWVWECDILLFREEENYSAIQIVPFVNKTIKLCFHFYLILATYPFVAWVGIESLFSCS
jgi:hypothetical protein